MSLQVSHQRSEREQIVALRRQSVFMFMVTHLDADGCFSGSDQYIANTVSGSNRKSVNRARKSLEETGDVMVIESDRYDANGVKLPNRVRPVPIKTFWVREWIRNGSKVGMSVHGENAPECRRINSSNDQGLPQEQSAQVSTVKRRGHDHKNGILNTELQHSLSVGLQSTERSVRWSVHGELDRPVRQALARLRDDLEKAKGYLAKYDSAINRETVRRIEQQIAELEGRQ